MKKRYAVILAAGQGTRMKSGKHKVLHPVCGKPIIDHILDALDQIGVDETIVVVGHRAEQVRSHVGERARFVEQKELLGTAHAVMQTASLLEGRDGTTLILYGDHPLYTAATFSRLVERHRDSGAAATLLTAVLSDPTGYGRVIRGEGDEVLRIVEHKDASPEELEVREVFTGTICIDNRRLFEALTRVNNDNTQGEYYLPDVVPILRQQGERIAAEVVDDPEEAMGVNNRVQLAEAEAVMTRRLLREHMLNGVTVIDPANTYIEADVVIGRDTVIYPGSYLKGGTVIGEGCTIGPQADLTDVRVGDGATIRYSVLQECAVEERSQVGPFAYIRPGSRLEAETKVGCFVDIKNARLGKGSKVSHLGYVGDADVGEGVNIGCGAVTVNYDGVKKHRTVIGDGAFIGCNVNLVAPVTVEKGAYIAAGSTVTDDVPEEALAIARERQVNKPGYAKRLKEKKS
ncbi:MAG: bifunctional UDP-N-acetylglucosamine diphosphorylase/glucosamine-1-phosphate N-acetyltransferase GlmU [Planifilum sp.]|mgnify:CR=1 FL=1